MKTLTRPFVFAALVLSAATALSAATTTKSKSSTFVIPPDVNGLKNIIPPLTTSKPVKAAIFQGNGAPDSGITNVGRWVLTIPGSTLTHIAADKWATVDLKPYNLVIFSGGSGSAQAKSIGEEGRKNVKEYVRNGGGYLGVCAGAYLACANFEWSLGIINAATVSPKWRRGQGFMDLELSDEGRKIIGDVSGTFKCRYHNGPIIKPAGKDDLPAYTPLCFFRTEICEYDAPKGVMINSPSHAMATFGKGRVFISSPHPENTPGLENFIPHAILWAAGADGR